MAEFSAQPAEKSEVVSSEDELLILVDEEDREIGRLDKGAVHDGDALLHRAFSLFIFNDGGELLLQQRAAGKRLWPLYWSNSCCSHPRAGESMDEAIERRLFQELGMHADLEFLFKFIYCARFGELGSERELCWVYGGRARSAPVVNTTEINAVRWLAPSDLDREMAEQSDQFTPWFQIEWRRIREQYNEMLGIL